MHHIEVTLSALSTHGARDGYFNTSSSLAFHPSGTIRDNAKHFDVDINLRSNVTAQSVGTKQRFKTTNKRAGIVAILTNQRTGNSDL